MVCRLKILTQKKWDFPWKCIHVFKSFLRSLPGPGLAWLVLLVLLLHMVWPGKAPEQLHSLSMVDLCVASQLSAPAVGQVFLHCMSPSLSFPAIQHTSNGLIFLIFSALTLRLPVDPVELFTAIIIIKPAYLLSQPWWVNIFVIPVYLPK